LLEIAELLPGDLRRAGEELRLAPGIAQETRLVLEHPEEAAEILERAEDPLERVERGHVARLEIERLVEAQRRAARVIELLEREPPGFEEERGLLRDVGGSLRLLLRRLRRLVVAAHRGRDPLERPPGLASRR